MNAREPEDQLIGLIAEHWESVNAALTDEQKATLLARLRALGDTAHGDEKAVRKARQGVRLALLPLPFGHPARAALESSRLAVSGASAVETVTLVRELLAGLATPRPGPAPDYTPPGDTAPDTAAIVDAVHRRLLRAPSLAPEEVRARFGGAAPPPEVIRLRDPERGDRYPEFQFTAGDASAHEVVLEVNRLLLADVDPWGAADWWLSGNVWLGGTPASLLGELPDERLVGAAAALVEGY
ncbi:hypothetical protein ABZZ17_37150 [Streptomyces sp. NPDC006512]|uniref:hypothetical protein n=1 Tax=Streptomyces sp. NPDC006512 TaxID=3154307 RepID=UPI0033A488CA